MSNIKKSARHGNFVIEQDENNAISISCHNTKQALRAIADELKMVYEEDQNTQYFGHRVINFINGVDTTRKPKVESEEVTADSFVSGNIFTRFYRNLCNSFREKI